MKEFCHKLNGGLEIPRKNYPDQFMVKYLACKPRKIAKPLKIVNLQKRQ